MARSSGTSVPPPGEKTRSLGSDAARQMVLSHSIWAVVGRALTMGAAIISTVLLARILDPADYGRFTVLRKAVEFLALLAAFGLGTSALVQIGSMDPDDSPQSIRRLIHQVLLIALGASVAVGFAAILLGVPLDSAVIGADLSLGNLIVVGFAVAALGFTRVVTEVIRGVGSPSWANLLGGKQGNPLGALSMTVVLLIIAVATQVSLGDAIYVYGATMVAVALLAQVILRRSGPGPSGEDRVDVDVDRARLFTTTWPIGLTSVILFASSQIDLFMTSRFEDEDMVAPYVAARGLGYYLIIARTMLSTASSGFVRPMLASGRRRELEVALQGGAALIFIPVFVACVVALLIPELVIRVILGPGYEDAAPLLRILVPAQGFSVLSGVGSQVLTLGGFERRRLRINMVGFLVVLLAGPWVANSHGAEGLAILTVAVLVLMNLEAWWAAKRLMGINTFADPRAIKAGYRTLRRKGRPPKPSVATEHDGTSNHA